MPSATALTQVRKLNAKTLALYAHLHSPAGQKLRAAQGLGPAPVIRSATEAEIMQVAAALDAGVALNPRLWVETYTVSAEASKLAA